MRIPFHHRMTAAVLLAFASFSTSGAIAQVNSQLEPNPTVQQLLDFNPADVKFDLRTLMDILRDHRHEGWVLSAYPDPTTHRPLIGAGFSLDLPERQHPQQDPFNPHAFIEPSSLELWQAAGLDPDKLQQILTSFNTQPVVRITRRHHRSARIARVRISLQISDDEADRLLRIAVIQAIYNAKAYCRGFDALTAPQQMAMTQLVYQMGVNLEQFNQFLNVINDDSNVALLVSSGTAGGHWQAAQDALIQSQWARLYRNRAIAVIAMLDPNYLDNPASAESRVSTGLPAPVVQSRHSRRAASLRSVSYRRHSAARKRISRSKRKA